MTTINNNQEIIKQNVAKFAEAAESFANKSTKFSAELREEIIKQNSAVNENIVSLFEKLKQRNENYFSEIQSKNQEIISTVENKILEVSVKNKDLGEKIENFTEKTRELNLRLDRFAAKTEFLEERVGILADKEHVDNSISAATAQQSLSLINQLASKEILEKIEKRIGGDDGEQGLNGKISTLANSIDNLNTQFSGKLNDVENTLAGKTTSKEFWGGICVTIVLAVFGAGASASWVINNAVSPFEDLDTKVEELESQNSKILEQLEEIQQQIKK
ncbi:hypothetical protein Xen7305DRAFT_00000660 [Xenococcus sp. PCC 7305]|uniref:hypothetical protein n=1 Tax=Xenococcus sp. PCC 7305 TaxID=102125 RepID=UPI0002AC6B77|nr:hypothetical protein [Xenococcus sp. PCC 7305]ELS00366.1 hypothetical protein Xen7305DRAFT_00000660 [Xenococcus sp. PCC 7305]